MTRKRRYIFLLTGYLIVMILLTLVPFKDSVNYDLNYNLVPFKSINNYLKHMKNYGIIQEEALKYLPFQFIRFASSAFTVSFKNLMGNILIFFPMGFIVPYVAKKRKMLIVILYSVIFSSFIEIMQLIYLSSRRPDVDDIILNTLGGIVGYLIFLIYKRIRE